MSKMKKAKVINIKDLIPINHQKINQDKVQTVNARDVHEFLEVKDRFADWIKQKIKKYDFVEGQDYVCFGENRSKIGSGGHNIKEYYISLDMAKELSMVQNNSKGKEARQYFIQCENTLKKLLSRQSKIDWKTARDRSILPQIEKTDTIKVFVEYAYAQGSKSAHTYYENIQKMEYNALFEGGYKHLKFLSEAFPNTKTLKDLLSVNQLFTLINADMIAEKALNDGMGLKMDYHDIFQLAKKRVLDFVDLVGKSPIFNHYDESKQILSAITTDNKCQQKLTQRSV